MELETENPHVAVSHHYGQEIVLLGVEPGSLNSLFFARDLINIYSYIAQTKDPFPSQMALVLPEAGHMQPFLNLLNSGLVMPEELRVDILSRNSGTTLAESLNEAYLKILLAAQKLGIHSFSAETVFGDYPVKLLNPSSFTRDLITCASIAELVHQRYKVIALLRNSQVDKSKDSVAKILTAGFETGVSSIFQFDPTLENEGYKRFGTNAKRAGIDDKSFAVSFPRTEKWGVLTELGIYHPRAIVADQPLMIEGVVLPT